MPVVGFGTGADPPVDHETAVDAVLDAIRTGYCHFDTAPVYNSEKPLGEAIKKAVDLGLIRSRSEVFVGSKLWCGDSHGELVLPAIRRTLENLGMNYIDLYLIHWPMSSKPGKSGFPIDKHDFLPLNIPSVWAAMEGCFKIGLTKAIGVSNFSTKKLRQILAVASIPPAVNQVEVNPCWQQKKLIDFCKRNSIAVVAYAPLGASGTFYGSNRVIENQVLQKISKSKGKSVAQLALRWCYEQGIGFVAKSFDKKRMKENTEIFDWSLTSEESDAINNGIPQHRLCPGPDFDSSVNGPFPADGRLWD
ncbi:hypothetical protein M569_13632, partial [Genlisea aurea]